MTVLPAALSRPISANSRAVSRGVERGRWLVEDDDSGIEMQRLGDFDQLPLARRQALDQRVGRQVELDFAQQGRRCVAAAQRGR